MPKDYEDKPSAVDFIKGVADDQSRSSGDKATALALVSAYILSLGKH